MSWKRTARNDTCSQDYILALFGLLPSKVLEVLRAAALEAGDGGNWLDHIPAEHRAMVDEALEAASRRLAKGDVGKV
jgi:hypothetical protein